MTLTTSGLLKTASLSLLFTLLSLQAQSQKDTEFWFVAPEISQNFASGFDNPVAFRFSTYGAPAVVNISQPANPAFPVQTLNIAPNSSGVLQLPPLFQFVENTPPNLVLNKGFLIESTSPITAYYEVIGTSPNNPEIFSLKGKNALGTTFYTPFQNVTDNSSGYTPLPHAAFDIVATEDNTLITITPTRAIVGHAANVPFNITLNRGQTYSGEAQGQLAAQHPTGSKIVSNKPIAVTIKDDLLEGAPLYGGFCRDLMGDQIVPIEKLGTRYVVQKGLLSGDEYAFVVATQGGTQVKLDGVAAGVINTGQQINLSFTNGPHFIESSAPVYVLQMTGNNCELAGEILPALDCSGSNSVRFVRSTDEPFYLFLTTRNGFEDGFLLNGNVGLIQASSFQVVPGSSGEFVAAVI
ncbi:MAG: IgGFc-binding protein, partial [Phycisphaerae bacterium]|nr:IgGFc-binding protein [Saprospiraceae bacterium]